ncbi:MAG TPA: glycosyl hydrolase [Candidatus Dormibacteraeota bacterium]|jgi:photosystem II stability/assembly factor-like uncharacterized protein
MRLLVAMNEELLVASGPDTWTAGAALEGAGPLCLAADPARPGVLYCGTEGRGVWRSDDAGATWRRCSEGIASEHVTAIAVDGDAVYAGTEPSALYRSEDGGETWRDLAALRSLPSAPSWSFPPRPHTSHVRQVLPRGDHIVVCIEAGALVRSDDGGETWVDRTDDGPRDTHTLRDHPRAPGRLYSAAGDGFGRRHGYAMSASGYNQSPDGGVTWERPDAGLGDLYLWGLAVNPGDPDVVVASASESPQLAHNPFAARSTVYRRAHGGGWTEVADGLPDPAGCVAAVLAANPAEPGAFYAASNRGGVHRSADGGQTWTRVPLPWPDRYERERVSDLLVIG